MRTDEEKRDPSSLPNNAAGSLLGSFLTGVASLFGDDPVWGRQKTKPRRPYHPQINRWTSAPHEHRREIARHLRQGL